MNLLGPRATSSFVVSIPTDLRFALEPLLEVIAAMTQQINGYDRQSDCILFVLKAEHGKDAAA